MSFNPYDIFQDFLTFGFFKIKIHDFLIYFRNFENKNCKKILNKIQMYSEKLTNSYCMKVFFYNF